MGNAKTFHAFVLKLYSCSLWIFSNFLLLSTMQQHLEVCIKKRSSIKQKWMEKYLMEKCLLHLACCCCFRLLPSAAVEHFQTKGSFYCTSRSQVRNFQKNLKRFPQMHK